MGKIIGIDLGTTNSVVSVMEGGEPVIITNASGNRTTPSVVAFSEGDRVVGNSAKNQAVTNPQKTIFSIKRFMGRSKAEAASEESKVPYELTGSGSGPVRVKIDDKDLSPPEISAIILKELKKYAEDYLGESVTEAVITVPAYFNDSQRQATKDAGEIAGLTVKRIINEPTAAALAYGLDKKQNQKILVFDLGGGTFDVSVLEIGDGVVEVKSTNGDTHLGGDTFDEYLIDYLVEDFKKMNGVDLLQDKMAMQRLKEACEKAKCELSSTKATQINLPFISQNEGQPVHFTKEITRAKFDTIIKPLVEKTLIPVRKALEDAGIEASAIDEILMVGGSTRIPAVQEAVKAYFGKDLNKSVNPDEVVAAGAAIQGAVLSGDKADILLLDVTSLSLGVETAGGVMTVMIPRNTTIPCQESQTFTTHEDNQAAVDVKIFQGERKLAEHNRSLGIFRLDGIPAAPKGIPKIELCFDIDANGILDVSARDLATNKEQKVTVSASSGLSDDEIEKMKTEAEKYAEEDTKKVSLISAKNKADSVIHQTEELLQTDNSSLEEFKDQLQAALAELQDILDTDVVEDIEDAIAKLIEVKHMAAEKMYAQQAPIEEEQEPVEESGD